MNLYFAYGSNMGERQMRSRCPDSRKLGHSILRGYRWIITSRGYASVLPSAAQEVEGTLWRISAEDERSLDQYEGVSLGHYEKLFLPVSWQGSESSALVYVDPVTAEGPPKEEYIGRINAGLADAALSDDYVRSQIRKFVPAD